MKMGVVALDGSQIAANAALEANRTYAHIQGEAERRLRVEKMLNDTQTQDEAEDRRYGADKRGCEPCEGDEMPDDFADPRSRRARLAVCKKQLEEKAVLGRQRNSVQRSMHALWRRSRQGSINEGVPPRGPTGCSLCVMRHNRKP